jgi:hypothetical protein
MISEPNENIRIEIQTFSDSTDISPPHIDETQSQQPIPSLVFIVPYRDREQQQLFFGRHMKYILSDLPPNCYEIYYAHQNDHRDFNRGAMRNIGFLAIKSKYPRHYQDITFVFNDVDTMPYTKNFINYYTQPGVVKHPYGFEYTLGGIVSINGYDFEKTNGYPNYWAWGYEDNMLQMRVIANNIQIDRSVFYPVNDKNIMQLRDGVSRTVNLAEYKRFTNNTTADGLSTITNIKYTISPTTGFIDITDFTIPSPNLQNLNKTHQLSSGNSPFIGRRGATMKLTM